MYYSNITNKELQEFHKVFVPNFTIKLTDALTSGLFKVDTIISDSIYKIYPLFYTNEITSSNPNDNILDNQCIICEKLTKETYLTFISNPNDTIKDYSNYATYFTVGDSLTTNQFNSIVSLLRHNIIHDDNIRINDSVTGKYGTYEFDITETTILDNGIVITDETILAEPKVKLTSPTFINSTYTLKLSVLHYTDVNILDDDTEDYKVIETLEIELTPNTWVDIPVATLEDGYIILFDSNVEIKHDKPIIQDWITHIDLSVTPTIIQTGDVADLKVTATDDMETGMSGKTIYFYEIFTPTVNLTADKNIIQTSEVCDLTAKVKDEDGSLVADTTVYFYIKED